MGEDFLRTVLKHLPRATSKEMREIERELRDHMEDAAELWERAGYSPEAAAAEAVKAMGDPAEIGDALNEQLSPFWLWLKRLSQAVCVIAAVGVVFNLLWRFCRPFQIWALPWVLRWGLY